jgi:hypothetical protein
MKKQIASLALILFSGFFFAGFSVVSAQTEDNDNEITLYKDITSNQCNSLQKKINLFEQLKRENDFNYEKLNYEKKAYQSELNGYIALEKALSCMNHEDPCYKNFQTEKKISKDQECSLENSAEEIDKLKKASKELSNSAIFFEEAETIYFGSRHLKLESGAIYDNKGIRIENSGLDDIMVNNIITRAGRGFLHSTQDSLRYIFRGNLIKKTNRALGTFAILYLFILGVKFIMARGDTERLSDLKGQFAWIILGLGVISIAEFVGYDVFDPSNGRDVLEGATTQNFQSKVAEIVRFVEYLAGGLMLINALISGYTLIMGGEEDEAISKEKQFLKSFLMGTAFILLAEVIVRALSFKDIRESSEIVVKEITGLVNFSLSFIGIVATAMLVMAGFYYVISFGDEEQMSRAKKMIIASIAGIIIAFSAYTIVRFLIV